MNLFYSIIRYIKDTFSNNQDDLIESILSNIQKLEIIAKEKEYKEKLFRILFYNIQTLLNQNVDVESMYYFLENISAIFNVTAIRIFKLNQKSIYPRYSWVHRDLDIETPKKINLKQFPRWYAFLDSGHIIRGNINEFPDEEVKIINDNYDLNFKFICLSPIISLENKSFIGTISIVNHFKLYDWTLSDEMFVQSITKILNTCIHLNPKLLE